jgi:long-chain acyl-CoA synthetase
VIGRFEAVCGLPLGQAYGIIEAGLPCINPGTQGLAATSVGRPVPDYEVMVCSRDGEHLDTGLSGEIGIRGPGLFSAYYSPWVLREAIARDGWFMTGDIGRLDEMGGLHLMGRKKSVIFVGGLKFFPDEVEACINQLPGIEESRVFGRTHPRLGEVPCAEIVARSPQFDLDALRAHCSRLLSPWKVPIEFTQVAALPKTAGGKILRWRPDEGRAPAARGGRGVDHPGDGAHRHDPR